jgi:hypothetical protein
MMKNSVRLLSLMLAALLILGMILPIGSHVHAAIPDYENTYVNTGDQRKDILEIAKTQLGYTEGPNNAAKYGAWGGYPNQPWCANFVSWCARQADISQDIITKSPVASPKRFGVEQFDGETYTPQPGDLFFTKNLSHTGLVYYVEGEYFYTIEGNANYEEFEDDYYVMTLKHKISDYYFGVPAYEGSGDHSYVRKQESAHPHKSYYECSDCGDKYYTGYDEVVQGCSRCLGCGCSDWGAGYYYFEYENYSAVYMRKSHSRDSQIVGGLIRGAVVYVYGVSYDGWAYVNYDGALGHVQFGNLKKYYPAPAAPVINTAVQEYEQGDTVKISWNKPENAEEYRVRCYKDGALLSETMTGETRSFTLENAEPGSYVAQVCAANKTGWSKPAEFTFRVRARYDVMFDPGAGSGGPKAASVLEGESLTIGEKVPALEGFTFAGWTDVQGDNLAKYQPGDTLNVLHDTTFYAVWRAGDAVPAALTVEQMPSHRVYLVGQTLDTDGLILRLTYSDDTASLVTKGYTAEGFSAQETGIQTVTVTYEGLSAAYDVEVVTWFAGDINLDNTVNRDDVMALLWHITFPDQFPISAPADFTGDGKVNRDDVMQILWHITFPDLFPLEA